MKRMGLILLAVLCLCAASSAFGAQTIHPDCVGDGVTDDTSCWQDAIDAATGAPYFGAIEAKSNAIYKISSTLHVHGALYGSINGNGAIFRWAGNSSSSSPLWLIEDAGSFKITNMTIEAGTSHSAGPLYCGIEFTRTGNYNTSTSGNIIEDVAIIGDAGNTDGLQFGIRFSTDHPGLGGDDLNNDQATIMNVTILGVARAAISIEHSQSMQHRLYNVNASAAAGNENLPFTEPHDYPTTVYGASFIRMDGGGFTSIGGYRNGFRNAEFYILRWNSPVTIIDSNSEDCARFLKSAGGTAWTYFPVTVYGGRYSANTIDCDGKAIDWHRAGPLVVRSMEIECPSDPNGDANNDGTLDDAVVDCNLNAGCDPGAPEVRFYIAPPGRASGYTVEDFEAAVEISDNIFWAATQGSPAKGSRDWNTVDLAPDPNTGTPIAARLTSHGNMCLDDTFHLSPCGGAAAGVQGFSGIGYEQLSAAGLELLDGHVTYCTNCIPHTSPCKCKDPEEEECRGTGAIATRLSGDWDCGGALPEDLGDKAANTVLAGPTSGADAPPTFRALVGADVPANTIALGSKTTGNYVASVATSSPLSGGASGTEGTVIALSIQNAAADSATKGAASFLASDFNDSSGNISIDYTNGQPASGSNKGFLTSADWTTFNAKVGASTTDTLTSKTIDATNATNVITIPWPVRIQPVRCTSATAATVESVSLPAASNQPTANCIAGSNTEKGVLDFSGSGSNVNAINFNYWLPSDVSIAAGFTLKIMWLTSATSGSVVWQAKTSCSAVDGTETDDPSYNTANTLTTAAPGTANRLVTSSITLTTTGCAAGEFLHVQIFRDAGDGSDTMNSAARMTMLGVDITRAM